MPRKLTREHLDAFYAGKLVKVPIDRVYSPWFNDPREYQGQQLYLYKSADGKRKYLAFRTLGGRGWLYDGRHNYRGWAVSEDPELCTSFNQNKGRLNWEQWLVVFESDMAKEYFSTWHKDRLN